MTMVLPDSSSPELPDTEASQGLRSRALQRMFEALYGPLVFLHEPAGRCLFGPAWHGRRLDLLDRIPVGSVVLDLGCGEGRLLRELRAAGVTGVGLDRALPVLLRARRSNVQVVAGEARKLPFRTGFFGAIVCTYPGPWIVDPDTWTELARVCRPGAPVTVLMGGTIERGRLSIARRIVHRAVYGDNDLRRAESLLASLGRPHFDGWTRVVDDRWGQALIWEGERREF